MHTVVLARGRLIDWSARQFDPAAEHPALIAPWRVFQADPDEHREVRKFLRENGIKGAVIRRTYCDVVD